MFRLVLAICNVVFRSTLVVDAEWSAGPQPALNPLALDGNPLRFTIVQVLGGVRGKFPDIHLISGAQVKDMFGKGTEDGCQL